MIRFSIIVPVYNVEKYINECVKSVLNQTFSNFELILVDDGSPDSCPQICDQYAKYDSRVHVIHKQNGGLSSARNAGIDKAVGEYILFLDSDDYWCDSKALEIINAYIIKESADVYIFGMKKYFQNSNKFFEYQNVCCNKENTSKKYEVKSLMEENIFVACAWDKALKRTVIEENNMRFIVGQMSEDIEWSAKILRYAKTINVIPKCFYVYRQQNISSITSNIGRKNLEHILHVIEKYAKSDSEDIKHFMANQYILWITTSNRVSRSEIGDLCKKSKEYWFLLNYDRYPYVRKAARVKFIGFHGLKFLLGVYRAARQGRFFGNRESML